MQDEVKWTNEYIQLDVERLFGKCEQNDIETHFELGRRLHTRDYFYAREYFQHSDKYKYAATRLVNKLTELHSNRNNTTLICNGSYAEQFMHEVVEQLKSQPNPSLNINYAIVDTSSESPSFYFEPKDIYEHIVIILPITCTYSTATKIESCIHYLLKTKRQKNKVIKIDSNVLCVFLILDERLDPIIEGNHIFGQSGSQIEEEVTALYDSFQWQKWEKGILTFLRNKNGDTFKGHSIKYLKSRLYLPEKCEKCFPVKSLKRENKELLEEICLVPTSANNDIPNLIYGLPRFANYFGNLGPVSKKDPNRIDTSATDDIFLVNFDGSHLFGHLQYDRNSYLHYIRRDKFYDHNKEMIKRFFKYELADLWENWKDEDRLLIITPKHNRSSSFLSDLIHSPDLSDKKVTLIMADPLNDYLENIELEYHEHAPYRKVIFFDYLISGAKIFKIILDRINIIKNNTGFDKILFIIDRTTQHSKIEILNTGHLKQNYFTAFIKLNVPLISAAKSGNPAKEKIRIQYDILKECHLDGLKLEIGNDIIYGAPKSLDELETYYSDPTNVSDRDKQIHLSKLLIAHLISGYFDKHYKDEGYSKATIPPFTEVALTNMISEIQHHKDRLFAIPVTPEINDNEKDSIIDDIIVKTLSRQPFKIYHGVYQTIFKYIINRMNEIVDQITREPNEKTLKRFKFYMKRCVEVNSNYIISHKFIAKLKKIFTAIDGDKNNKSLLSTKYFILKCYKELIYKNQTRSIKLEENINHEELLPDPLIKPGDFSLESALQDEFYQLGRIIKVENIHLLNKLKKHFLIEVKEGKLDLEQTKNRGKLIEDYLTNDGYYKKPILRLVDEFIQNGRIQREKKDIKKNIAYMLETVYLLEHENKKKNDFQDNVKEILKKASQIISQDPDNPENLEYGFFIEYKERNEDASDQFADNIYSIFSNVPNDNQPKIDKNGFIYRMLYGLKTKEGNQSDVLTFVALAKDEKDTVLSFDTEFSSFIDKECKNVLPDSIRLDYKSENRGNEMFENAKMILLFRLSDISYDKKENNYIDKGQAVFAICYPKSVFKSSGKEEVVALTDFLNVERVRLLLLIKTQLLDYLKNLFANDVFISLNTQNENNKLKRVLNHGIASYLDAFKYLLDETIAPPKERLAMIEFLQTTIMRHLTSFTEDEENFKRKEGLVSFNQEYIINLVHLIMSMPGIGYSMEQDEYHLICDIPMDIECHPAIIEQIIPELIVNMKIYSYGYKGKREHTIKYEDECLVFKNYFHPTKGFDPTNIKVDGGKAMCNRILSFLNRGQLSQQKAQEINLLTVKFNLYERNKKNIDY